MEYLKCNQLACRNVLRETAVVTTCSHVFCIACANALFGNTQVCPACAASLTEPDDIVVCALQPTNDYKTSVLSGLSPGIILQICERAVSFWEYQARQESAFQQAVLKSVNDKSAQCQKQLDSVLREANSELGLLNDKVAGLQRELELERRKNRDFHEQLREKDKEYAKLKSQYEHLKRKTLFAPGTLSVDAGSANQTFGQNSMQHDERSQSRGGTGGLAGFESRGGTAGLAAFADVTMESGGVQRTPLRGFGNGASSWLPPPQQQNMSRTTRPPPGGATNRNRFQSYPSGQMQNERSSTGSNGNASMHLRRDNEGNTSDSANEVESLLGLHSQQNHRVSLNQAGAGMNRLQAASSPTGRQAQPGFSFGQSTPRGVPGPSSEQRRSGTFRPAAFLR